VAREAVIRGLYCSGYDPKPVQRAIAAAPASCYEAALVLTRSLLAVALVVGCQGRSSTEDLPATPRAIEVHDASGKVTARVVPGHPCRATVDGIELLVGGRPLIAQVGDVRWSGDDEKTGTTLRKDGVAVVRIFPAEVTPGSVDVIDSQGVALFRVKLDGETAPIVNKSGEVERVAKRTAKAISVGDVTVTGTDDLLLAALLTAPEAGAEVRGLAACHRLLPIVKGS
jgi:hypothetical protein